MACVKLPVPPPLPPLGPIGLPSLQLPAFDAGANLCCQINISAWIPLPPLPPLPLLGAVLAAINAEIALLDSVLDFLDTIALSCPLDDGPINLAA